MTPKVQTGFTVITKDNVDASAAGARLQIQLLDHRCAVPVFLPAPRAPATSAIPNAIIGAAAKASGNQRSGENEAAFGQSLPSPEIITLGAGRKPR